MKKTILGLMAAGMVFGAAASAKTIELSIDSTKVFTEDTEVQVSEISTAPFIENDRTYVPVRFISENLGATVGWEPDTRRVTISSGDNTVSLIIDNQTASINGVDTTIDAAPVIVNDTTFVPVRFVSEALKSTVTYIPETRQVLVSDSKDALKINDNVINIDYLKTFYNMNKQYLQMMGEDEYFKTILNDVTSSYAIYSQWSQIDQNQTLAPEMLEQLNQITDDQFVNQGVLKGYFVMSQKIYSVVNSAYTMMQGSFNDEMILEKYNTDYVAAKHILIPTVNLETGEELSEADQNKAKTLATDVLRKARAGSDFDELVTKYSKDPGSISQPDGYVFTKNQMVAEFEDATYKLTVGKISEVVKSKFGYHIIKRLELPEISDETKNTIKSGLSNDFLDQLAGSAGVDYLIPEEDIHALIK